VRETLCINSHQLMTLTDQELKDKMKTFFSQFHKNVIYIISLEKTYDHKHTQALFRNYKNEKIHSLSKINYPSQNWRPNSQILYVGSSKASNLNTRMRNHFGVGSKSVYSLHLKHWIKEDFQNNIRVDLFQIDSPENRYQNINLLELIEQGFWDELKPMFGKRSGLL
jgi:hypothetical protein